jgi:hypothetical protein
MDILWILLYVDLWVMMGILTAGPLILTRNSRKYDVAIFFSALAAWPLIFVYYNVVLYIKILEAVVLGVTRLLLGKE